MNATTSSRTVEIFSKNELESYFKCHDPYLHLYELGDLDDFFWHNTRWFGIKELECSDSAMGAYQCVALLYSGGESESVFIVHSSGSDRSIQFGTKLLNDLVHDFHLPHRFHSHMHPSFIPVLENYFNPFDLLKHFKMKFVNNNDNVNILAAIDTSSVVNLTPQDIAEVEQFYSESYPGNWFDPRMLESTKMFGLFCHEDTCTSPSSHGSKEGTAGQGGPPGRTLLAVAGIHVYSEDYQVAALGNIAVRPEYRGQGLAMVVIAALLKSLISSGDVESTCHGSIEHIGLNVDASNIAAIKCYQKLGFEIISEFYEVMWDQKECQGSRGSSLDYSRQEGATCQSTFTGPDSTTMTDEDLLLHFARVGDCAAMRSLLESSKHEETVFANSFRNIGSSQRGDTRNSTHTTLTDQQRVDVNCRDTKLRTPLHVACDRGHSDCVNMLLALPGVDVNAQSNTGVTPLVMSAVKGHTEAVKAMLQDARVDPNAVGFRGRGAVVGAALHSHPKTLEILLRDTRVNACIIDEMNRTPLIDATLNICKKGLTHARRQVLSLLLDMCRAETRMGCITEALELVNSSHCDGDVRDEDRAEVVALLEGALRRPA
mmetsp:Transcript_12407/g.20165  ORF Transcript_12407/g.20165 Transcript_12407/m.20165 type:complete len:600 (-) Transcript_12407:113-1912(-)